MPDRPLTLQELYALRAKAEAQNAVGGAPGPAPFTATVGGPSPAQEAQAVGAATRGVPTLGTATPAQLQEAAVRTTATAAGLDPDNPVRSGAVLAGTLIGGPALGAAGRTIGLQRLAAPAVGLMRLSNGQILRAGAPIMEAGARMMDRAIGAGAGALLGSELTKSPTETSPEAQSRRLWDAALGAGTETLAPLGVGAVRATRALPGTTKRALFGPQTGTTAREYFMDRLLGRAGAIPLIPHAEEIQAALRRRGQTATIGQLSTSSWHQTTESLLQASWTGRQQYDATHAGALDAAWADYDAALPKFGQAMSQEEKGRVVDAVVNNSEELKNLAVDAQYAKARALAESRGVSDAVVTVDSVIHDMYNDKPLQNALAGGNEFAKTIWDTVVSNLADAEALPVIKRTMGTSYAPISFEHAEALRRTLMGIAGSPKESTIKGAQKLAIGVAKSLDRAMDNAAKVLGVPEVRSAYLAARSFTKTANEPFNDPALAVMLGVNRPEQIAQAAVRAGTPSAVKSVMRVADNPEYQQAVIDAVKPYGGSTVQDFKDMMLNNFLDEAAFRAGRRTSTVETVEEPSGLGRVLAQATGMGKKEVLQQGNGTRMLNFIVGSKGVFEELVPDPAKRLNLEKVARTIQASESRAKERLATMFFQMTQAATGALAMRGLMTGFQDGVGMVPAGMVWLPKALASYTNAPRVVDWMVQRAKTAPSRAGAYAGRAAAQWALDSTAEYIARLREAGIPFTYRAPDGQETTFTPDEGAYGPLAPTAAGRSKPTAKGAPTGR